MTLQGVNPVADDLAAVATRVAATNGSSLYYLIVTNGLVTDRPEIYLP